MVPLAGISHQTSGTIPSHSSLTMRYTGTLLYDRWISFVDASLNAGRPCEDGHVAAAAKDKNHSGSVAAVDNIFMMDTETLSPAEMAVCYAESGEGLLC